MILAPYVLASSEIPQLRAEKEEYYFSITHGQELKSLMNNVENWP